MEAKEFTPRLLKLVEYEHAGLRHKTAPVTFPLSDEVQQIIADMLYSVNPEQLREAGAPWDHPVGMAANQWGIDLSIFLYCPDGDTHNAQVIINPSYEPITSSEILAPDIQEDWEGCFSVPLATGNIQRNRKIKVKYQDVHGQTFTKVLAGWPARVWQHENDHVNGHLYDDPRTGKCLEKKVFTTREAVDDFYDEIREKRKG